MRLMACLLLFASASLVSADYYLATDNYYYLRGGGTQAYTRHWISSGYSNGCYSTGYYQYVPYYPPYVAPAAKAKSIDELIIDLAAAKQSDAARLALIDRLGLKAEQPVQRAGYGGYGFHNGYGALGATGNTFAGYSANQLIHLDPYGQLDLNAALQGFALTVQELNRSGERLASQQGQAVDKLFDRQERLETHKATLNAILKAAAKPSTVQTTVNSSLSLSGAAGPKGASNTIDTIRVNSCSSCHGPGGSAADKYQMRAWADLTADEKANERAQVASGRMPKGSVLPQWARDAFAGAQ